MIFVVCGVCGLRVCLRLLWFLSVLVCVCGARVACCVVYAYAVQFGLVLRFVFGFVVCVFAYFVFGVCLWDCVTRFDFVMFGVWCLVVGYFSDFAFGVYGL